MFKRKPDSRQATSKEICLLGADVHFEGSLRFEGTLAIDGIVIGAVTASVGSGSLLSINQQAQITGDVTADMVLISGRVQGDVHARQRVELMRTAHLVGDIYTKDIMVEGGAGFEGFCHMEGDGSVTAGDRALKGDVFEGSVLEETELNNNMARTSHDGVLNTGEGNGQASERANDGTGGHTEEAVKGKGSHGAKAGDVQEASKAEGAVTESASDDGDPLKAPSGEA